MVSGIGEVLVNLISYPVLIGSILICAISLIFLIAKRKALKKEVKVLMIVLAIITGVIIGIFIFLVFAFGSNHPPAPPVPQSPNTNSGVEMTVNTIMPHNGVYVTLENKTGNEFTYGSDFVLYVYENDSWEVVQPIIDNWGFDDIGYIIAPQSKSDEIFIDWSWLYGELPGGDYKIHKEVLLVRSSGDFDRYLLEAGFSIPRNINTGPTRP